MENFFLVLVCIALGFVVRRWSSVPADSYKAINAWVLYVAVPALALRYISAIEWNVEMLLPLGWPLIIWGGAWLYVGAYSRYRNIERQTHVALLMATGMGNTAFLGFPLITAFYGAAGLSIAAICEFGTFIVFCTFGVAVVLNASSSEGKVKISLLIKRMCRFPAFIAFVAAILLSFWGDISFSYPFLDLLVATLSPLSLFSIGMQLSFKKIGTSVEYVSVALLYKLLLSPLLVLGIAWVCGAQGLIGKVSIIESGMGPHITASLLASQYNQNPHLCSLMVGVGILGALITTPVLWRFVEFIF